MWARSRMMESMQREEKRERNKGMDLPGGSPRFHVAVSACKRRSHPKNQIETQSNLSESNESLSRLLTRFWLTGCCSFFPIMNLCENKASGLPWGGFRFPSSPTIDSSLALELRLLLHFWNPEDTHFSVTRTPSPASPPWHTTYTQFHFLSLFARLSDTSYHKQRKGEFRTLRRQP